jgi:hypothetical protein
LIENKPGKRKGVKRKERNGTEERNKKKERQIKGRIYNFVQDDKC